MIEISGGKTPLPKTTIAKIARAVVGARFSLSLVIATSKEIQQLNSDFRDKNEPTDVLAFPLSDDEGESFACPEMISKKFAAKIYPKFVTSERSAFAFAVIHSLLHLVGYDHGSTMEKKEREHMLAFESIIDGKTSTRSRNRHRNDDRKSGRRSSI
jgi:rRNA maturation RNase YbeY